MMSLLFLLHRLDPEWIHEMTIRSAGACGRCSRLLRLLEGYYGFEDQSLNVQLGNLHFPNPIGLAAGFDKNGEAVAALQTLGFGFIEVGTVTPKPQAGNPRPRLFRLKKQNALLNRMGFNNRGTTALTKALADVDRRVPIGVNLGKNRNTPLDNAMDDYVAGMASCWEIADYFVINISSPNTEGLRDLQDEDYLLPLLRRVLGIRDQWSDRTGSVKQVWLKIAPDLETNGLKSIAQIALETRVDALILTNTTRSRIGIPSFYQTEEGGLSGDPLYEISNQVLAQMHRLTGGRIPLIGAGGVSSIEHVVEKMRLGARLVQLYTGLVFRGPGLIRKIKQELAAAGLPDIANEGGSGSAASSDLPM